MICNSLSHDFLHSIITHTQEKARERKEKKGAWKLGEENGMGR